MWRGESGEAYMIKRKSEIPLDVYTELRNAYLRYYDTAFLLRDQGMMDERREILESEDADLFSEPLIEPVPFYESDSDLRGLIDRYGLDSDCIEALYDAFFPDPKRSFGGPAKVREHQYKSLETALSDGPAVNPIVTAGTGSGKTESFLLPVLARLIMEARTWSKPGPAPLDRWWRHSMGVKNWESQRAHETRPAAIRAIFIYPTNALVEDQIIRLRRALDAMVQ